MIHRSRVFSATVRGVEGEIVHVEVLLDSGLPGTSILGLPDSSVRESRDRVKAAIHSSGFEFPPGKVLVNLAPAHTRKEGPWFDLPIALAILSAYGTLPNAPWKDSIFVGELALDGTIRPVRGILSIALAARAHGFERLYTAEASAAAAGRVDGLEVFTAPNLWSLARILTGQEPAQPRAREAEPAAPPAADEELLLEDVIGQGVAKRALLLAAAGGHNLLFVGSPGAGKSMLAQRLPGLLPPPTSDEVLEIAQIHDLLAPGGAPIAGRPFRAPHHTTSRAGLVGGGPDVRPGEISLAHLGVLFLDELAEFPRETLDALRQPIEEGRITLARASGSYTFPARFQLIAAMNPCPCGWLGHPIRACVCTPRDLAKVRARVSGPLLDRIDLFVSVAPVPLSDLTARDGSLPTARVREAVLRCREVERRRFAERGVRQGPAVNAALRGKALQAACRLDARSRRILEAALEKFGLSLRAHARTLRVARTIADLAGSDEIRAEHVAEALGFRLVTDAATAKGVSV